MRNIFLLVLLLICIASAVAQKGTYILSKWHEKDIDKKYEQIIGDTTIFYNNQVYLYWIVKYDYGEPPPSSFEIASRFFTKNVFCRGWRVKFTKLFSMKGATEGFGLYLVTSTNKKATFYQKSYTDTINIAWGNPGYSLEVSIKDGPIK